MQVLSIHAILSKALESYCNIGSCFFVTPVVTNSASNSVSESWTALILHAEDRQKSGEWQTIKFIIAAKDLPGWSASRLINFY